MSSLMLLRKPLKRGTAVAACVVVAAACLCACTSSSGRPPDAVQPPQLKTRFDRQKDVVYSPAGHPQTLSADLYVPNAPGLYAGVVVVHGGGWNGRDRSDMDSISKQLAERGYVVANIDYRLAPQFRHPAQVDDVRAAVTYLRMHAAELKLDPQRIGGWGYSAGAHLLTLAATDRPPAAVPIFDAVVAGGVPADFSRYPKSPVITELLGASLQEAPDLWKQASPITHVSADDPPMFLFYGSGDRIVESEESVELQRRLHAVGVPAERLEVKGLGHIATFLLSGEARKRGIDFLDRYLR